MSRWLKYIVLFSFITYGCLDKSDCNLYENYKKELVIEARISDDAPPYRVKISETVNPNLDIDSSLLQDAIVILSDMNGNSETLESKGNGIYESSNINGNIGDRYGLNVYYEGENFEAFDEIKSAPLIDSAKSEYAETTIGNGYYIVLYGKNHASTNNYYKVEFIVNNQPLLGYYNLLILEDISLQESQAFLLPEIFQYNDTVVVEVHSISKQIYEYFRGINKQVDNLYGNVQAPILNPPSNFKKGLGYFMASSVWRDTVLVK